MYRIKSNQFDHIKKNSKKAGFFKLCYCDMEPYKGSFWLSLMVTRPAAGARSLHLRINDVAKNFDSQF